eukprot:Opistho-2@35209
MVTAMGSCLSKCSSRRTVQNIAIIFVSTLVVLAFAFAALRLFMSEGEFKRLLTAKCYTDERVRDEVRRKVVLIAQEYERHNITYWLDYGTALGAWRERDMIAWDHNADLSFFGKDRDRALELAYEVVTRNNLPRNRRIDLFAWELGPDGLLHRSDGVNSVVVGSATDSFDPSFVTTTTPCSFAGADLQCPNRLAEFVRLRYPYTYDKKVPYKARCLRLW